MLTFILCKIKPFFELIYFASGVIIAITAIKALGQLKLTKKTLSTNSERDALRITAEQCDNYLKNIIPLQIELNEQIEKNNVKFFDNWKIEINKGDLIVFHDPPTIVNNDCQPVIDIVTNTLDA